MRAPQKKCPERDQVADSLATQEQILASYFGFVKHLKLMNLTEQCMRGKSIDESE